MFKPIAFLLPFFTYLAVISCAVSCSPQPYIYVTYFDALPSPINAGQVATLHWNVTGADTVVIDNGIGEVPPYGRAPVSPLQTTMYTLTARNAARIVTTTARLEVATPTSRETASPAPGKMPQAPNIQTYSPLDSAALLKQQGNEIEVKGKVTLIKKWPLSLTNIRTSIYFCENSADASFPGSTANADPLDYTSYFRGIIKPEYYNTFYDYSGWLSFQAGDTVNITGVLETFNTAPVIFLKSKSQLTVSK
jgi:hypothetical protein